MWVSGLWVGRWWLFHPVVIIIMLSQPNLVRVVAYAELDNNSNCIVEQTLVCAVIMKQYDILEEQ